MRLEWLRVGRPMNWPALTLAHQEPSKQGESRNRVEKIIRLSDKTHRRCFIDRTVIKGGRLEHLDHFAGYPIAPLG